MHRDLRSLDEDLTLTAHEGAQLVEILDDLADWLATAGPEITASLDAHDGPGTRRELRRTVNHWAQRLDRTERCP